MWWMGFTHFFDTQPFLGKENHNANGRSASIRIQPKPDGYICGVNRPISISLTFGRRVWKSYDHWSVANM